MIGQCEVCRDVTQCPVCRAVVRAWSHVGVRTIQNGHLGSGLYHYAQPCGHGLKLSPAKATAKTLAVYNGGPLWKDGYEWFDLYWGSWFETNSPWVASVEHSVANIEADESYSAGLSEYNVGIGKVNGSLTISTDPPKTLSDQEVAAALKIWIQSKMAPDFQGKGAYNIFLPPGVTAILGGDSSCSVFCDYHDAAAPGGPYFTVEPYPCKSGCNQCTQNDFDTLTQGLSEEMIELKTDMNPGTGWVIGNEEICDYCDAHFKCNQIATGEYVNAWYSNKLGACWSK